MTNLIQLNRMKPKLVWHFQQTVSQNWMLQHCPMQPFFQGCAFFDKKGLCYVNKLYNSSYQF